MIADRTYEFEGIDSKYVNEQTLKKTEIKDEFMDG